MCFNPQGSKVLTASTDTTARIWEVETGLLLQTLDGHTDEIFSCAFNYEGNTIITGKCITSLNKTFLLISLFSLFLKDQKIILAGSGNVNALWFLESNTIEHLYSERFFFLSNTMIFVFLWISMPKLQKSEYE